MSIIQSDQEVLIEFSAQSWAGKTICKPVMDFVEWFGLAFNKMIKAFQGYGHGWHAGIRIEMLADAVFPALANAALMSATTQNQALLSVIYEMEALGLIRHKDKTRQVYDSPLILTLPALTY